MNRCMLTFSIVGCLLLGLAGVVRADKDSDLRAEISRLQQRLSEVESKQSQNWLNERRAEEIKSLVQDVLADADTRASLMADGAVAGHDGNHFFLASADGGFLLNVAGQIQLRYVAGFNQGTAPASDEEDQGFQIRRAKLTFSGHVEAGGQWGYLVRLATARSDGDVGVEDIYVSRKLADNVTIQAGLFKLPFMREELTSSTRQQAVERSGVNELFSVQRSEQIQVQVTPMDNVRVLASFSDGANENFSDLGADPAEIAITARVDVALQGSLDQIKDFAAWSGEATGIFLGGAVHWQTGDGFNGGGAINAASTSVDYLSWTIDGSVECSGFNLFAAYVGNSIDATTGGVGDFDQMGFVVQAGYMVIPDKLEPFVRLEYMEDDSAGNGGGAEEDAWVITFGANYYFEKGHDAKFTADVVWLVDGRGYGNLFNGHGGGAAGGAGSNGHSSTGSGFSEAGATDEGAILLRLQFQLLF